jgi:hypothetical protein
LLKLGYVRKHDTTQMTNFQAPSIIDNATRGCYNIISSCCGKPSVTFRSATAATNSRYFRGAKGDDRADLLFPQQKLIGTRGGKRHPWRRDETSPS